MMKELSLWEIITKTISVIVHFFLWVVVNAWYGIKELLKLYTIKVYEPLYTGIGIKFVAQFITYIGIPFAILVLTYIIRRPIILWAEDNLPASHKPLNRNKRHLFQKHTKQSKKYDTTYTSGNVSAKEIERRRQCSFEQDKMIEKMRGIPRYAIS